MSYLDADKQIMNAFETWWHREGSAMRPLDGKDQEEHVKRISAIAWSNGAYVNGVYDLLEKPSPSIDSSIKP